MFNYKGFTFIELIIVVVITGIIACFAVPYFQHLLISNEVNHFKRTITIYIQKAKTDARLYHRNVTLCASEDLKNCHGDWTRGFIGFIDSNNNRTRDLRESILYSEAFQYKYGTLMWKGTLSINSITFQGDTGLPRGSNGSFIYCMNAAAQHTKLVLSNMGNIRIEKTSSC